MAAVAVVARLRAKPGKLSGVLAALPPLVAATHAEEGCVEYVAHVSPDQPDEMCFLEKWESRQALDKHLATEHIGAFRETTGPLLESADVTVWDVHELA